MDVWEAFDTVPYNILVSKSERREFDGLTTRWMRNQLDGLTQNGAVISSTSKSRAERSGISQELLSGLTLFNIFDRDTDSGIECTSRKFANYAKLCSATSMLEGRDTIQRDLDRLETWAHDHREVRQGQVPSAWTWVGAILSTNTSWAMTALRAALCRT